MQDVVPKHVSSTCSEMSASCTTSSSLEDRKIHNQGTLLDDYQNDDEMGHTTDLLHAIRCWNLDRPIDAHHEGDNDDLETSMMVEQDSSDLEYQTHNSPMTTINKSNNTTIESTTQPMHSSIQQHALKTPIVTASVMKQRLLQQHRGNYSAKASSLTARLLEEDFVPSCLDQSVIVHHPPIKEVENIDENDSLIYNNVECRDHVVSSVPSVPSEEKDGEEEEGDEKREDKDADDQQQITTAPSTTKTISSSTLKSKRRETSKSLTKEQADPVKILEESAVLLGLPKNDWHSVTTTIKRLVRVVEQHVPKLEGFITDVCQEMEQLESSLQQSSFSSPSEEMKDSSLCYDDSESTTTATTVTTATTTASMKLEEEGKEKQRNHNKRKKSERKERMANALKTLKRECSRQKRKLSQQERTQQQNHPHHQGAYEKKHLQLNLPVPSIHNQPNVKNNENLHVSIPTQPTPRRFALQTMDENNMQTPKVQHLSKASKSVTKPSKDVEFRSLVILMLADREERQMEFFADDKRRSKQQITLTDTQAIQIIEDLLVIEERYINIQSTTSQERLSDLPISPQNADGVITELFDTDPTTLRRFVLHFSYLFSVRQDEIMGKMQELYIFSSEAHQFINRIKEQMGLALSCPLHSVERVCRETLVLKGGE